MTKVAVIADTWFPFIGGGQVSTYEIHKRIKKGLMIDIVTPNNGSDRHFYPKNVKQVKIGPYTKPTLSFLPRIIYLIRLFSYLKSSDYSLIVIHPFFPAIPAKLINILKKTPIVMTVHGTSMSAKKDTWWKVFLQKIILTKIKYNAEISVSRDFLEFPNVNKKIYYIPNGVDIRPFDKIEPNKKSQPQILLVGRLHYQKNICNLIKAFQEVLAFYPGAKLTIVGEGPQKIKLLNVLKNIGLSKFVIFKGQVHAQELIKIYKSSTLFILPSIFEGQPLSLLEAWAAKLPVITTKTGDCRFLVKEGVNGYLIEDPQNPSEIAKLIVKALNAKNLQHMGQNGYNLVAKNFSWDKSAQTTLKLYESLTKTQN